MLLLINQTKCEALNVGHSTPAAIKITKLYFQVFFPGATNQRGHRMHAAVRYIRKS
jgi:hypothetical protein